MRERNARRPRKCPECGIWTLLKFCSKRCRSRWQWKQVSQDADLLTAERVRQRLRKGLGGNTGQRQAELREADAIRAVYYYEIAWPGVPLWPRILGLRK